MLAGSVALHELGETDATAEPIIEETARSSNKSQVFVAAGGSKYDELPEAVKQHAVFTTNDLIEEPEKFDDMSYGRTGLILFRCVRPCTIPGQIVYLTWVVWACAHSCMP